MPEQITIKLEGNEDVITYDEWREFVEKRRGKWRGVASREGAEALRAYVDSHAWDDDEGEEVARLKAEIDRLKSENERLTQENERLHAMLNSGAAPSPSAGAEGDQTKNDPEQLSNRDGAFGDYEMDGAAGTDETDKTGVFSWESYNPDTDDVTVPADAIEHLPNEYDTIGRVDAFHGEELPAINPDHIEDLPKDANAKAAAVAGVVRYTHHVVEIGEIIATAKDVLGNDTTGYVRRAIVFNEREGGPDVPVTAWLAGRHPDDDAQWVTTVEAFEEVLEEQATEAATERGRVIEEHVGLAFAAGQYLDESPQVPGAPKMKGYKSRWEDLREMVVEVEEMHSVAYRVIKDALNELYDTGKGARLGVTGPTNWESVWAEWPGTAEGLVEWWESEKSDRELSEFEQKVAVFDIHEWMPDRRESFDGEYVEEL